MGKEETFFMLAVGNGTTWGRLKPNTKIQKNNIQKILNFYPRFESAPGQPPFPTTQNLKKLLPIC